MKRKSFYGDAFTAIIDAPTLTANEHQNQMRRFLDHADGGTFTVTGFWGPEDAFCVVCRRGIDTRKEVSAQLTTDTEPTEYLGEVCRDCCLKALETVK